MFPTSLQEMSNKMCPERRQEVRKDPETILLVGKLILSSKFEVSTAPLTFPFPHQLKSYPPWKQKPKDQASSYLFSSFFAPFLRSPHNIDGCSLHPTIFIIGILVRSTIPHSLLFFFLFALLYTLYSTSGTLSVRSGSTKHLLYVFSPLTRTMNPVPKDLPSVHSDPIE